jgi:hypothetical protein
MEDRFAQWSNIWKLYFKASKSCEVVFHSRRRQLYYLPSYLKGDVM